MSTKTRTITLASGKTAEVPADLSNVVGMDDEGRIVVDHFDALADDAKDGAFLFGLTLCCNASDKGVEDGVVCRGCYSYDDTGMYHFRNMADPSCPFPGVDLIIDDPAPAAVVTTKKEPRMTAKTEKKKSTAAAAQFTALGIDEADYTDAMRLAVKQRWSNLPVDQKVDDLRAALAAVKEPALPTDDELVAAGFTTDVAKHDEMARRKRNAKVQAWRARKQIQAALDARDLRFRAMRAKRSTAKAS